MGEENLKLVALGSVPYKPIVPVALRHKMKKNKALFLDIMLNDRFVCTLKYMYCPLFAIRYEELLRFVRNKRPSLKGKPFRIMF